MPNAWITALKKFNEGKGTWCLPKKGTKEYDEVRALMVAKPKEESAPKEPAPKEESAPKKKPSIKAMAEAYNVPLPLLKKAAQDYYRRVSDAGSEADRKKLIDNMPDQLRKGFLAYQKKMNK
jgi:hypothetical protein